MALLHTSATCIKYVLFAFNFVFVLTGIIIISVGATVGSTYGIYNSFLEPRFFSIPTLLIVIGSFIFIIAFFGCCGAIKENYCMILTFSVLLGIIFILELSAGISGYVLRSEASELISGRLTESMKLYTKDGHKDVTVLWDTVQHEFKCCGIKGAADWNEIYTNKSVAPLSCCTIPNGVTNYTCTISNENDNLYRTGCLALFSDYISSHAVSLGAAGIFLAVVQFAGIFFACYIAREIRIFRGTNTI